MVNNLQIEVKRHKLQQQFLEQIEFGNHSPQPSASGVKQCSPLREPLIKTRTATEDTLRSRKPELEMIDTEHQELKKVMEVNNNE